MCSFVIGGFQKSSLIDYPGKISAIIFTQGCNFRCPYCHNPELIGVEVNGKREMGNSIEVKSKKQKVKSDEHTFNLLPFALRSKNQIFLNSLNPVSTSSTQL